MRRLIPIASVVAALVLGGAGAVGARTFDFFGSGHGHGIGMSQYGALGLAREGWPAARILRHYYTGTRVRTRPPPEPRIRVGLVQGIHETRLRAEDGPFDIELSSGRHIDTVPAGSSRRVRIVDGEFHILTPGDRLVGGHPWGGRGRDLVARPGRGQVKVSAWGHSLGRGELVIDIVRSGSAHLVGAMSVESYLLGISEVPSEWHRVALAVQAIASRSYGYWRLAGAGQSGCSCDILGTSRDQVYAGYDKESGPSGERWVAAVRDTRRRVVVYHGRYVYTVYGASSGGYTEDIQRVWPAAAPAPHLKGVCDPEDDVPENANTSWRESFEAGALTDALRSYTGDIGRVRRFTGYDRGVSGRVTRVRVVGASGASVVEGWDIRTALSLPDTRFSVNRNLNIGGRIRAVYDRAWCRPGVARSADRNVAGGEYQRFARGRIYVNDGADAAVWLRGAVLGRYVRLGAHRSDLGLPRRFERVEGGSQGWFDDGTIACTPGCHVNYD